MSLSPIRDEYSIVNIKFVDIELDENSDFRKGLVCLISLNDRLDDKLSLK
jgi:hypothetical protein